MHAWRLQQSAVLQWPEWNVLLMFIQTSDRIKHICFGHYGEHAVLDDQVRYKA
jgi:hypothetical protein